MNIPLTFHWEFFFTFIQFSRAQKVSGEIYMVFKTSDQILKELMKAVGKEEVLWFCLSPLHERCRLAGIQP